MAPASPFEPVLLRRNFPLRHLRAYVPTASGPFLGQRWREVQQKVVERQKAPTGSLCVLWGARGTGKTQIAVNAAIDFPWNAERPNEMPLYAKISDIFRDVRSTFRKDATLSESDVLKRFTTARLLVIDEAQERGETDFEQLLLTHIIDKRYDSFLHTLIISNLTKHELGKSLGSSIVSRSHECGEVFECNWPSFREGATRITQ